MKSLKDFLSKKKINNSITKHTYRGENSNLCKNTRACLDPKLKIMTWLILL